MGLLGRVLWQQLEDVLYKEYMERRKAGRTVRQGWFHIQSRFQLRMIYLNVNPEIFRFRNSRFQGFLKCLQISLRSITKKAQNVSEDYEVLMIN